MFERLKQKVTWMYDMVKLKKEVNRIKSEMDNTNYLLKLADISKVIYGSTALEDSEKEKYYNQVHNSVIQKFTMKF